MVDDLRALRIRDGIVAVVGRAPTCPGALFPLLLGQTVGAAYSMPWGRANAVARTTRDGAWGVPEAKSPSRDDTVRDMGKRIRDIVIDKAMDAYVEWREESAQVESAYRRWTSAAPSDAALAFAAYVAALDREDRASICFEQVVRRAVVVRERGRRSGLRLRDAT
jgi:hypothetical protein